MLADLLTRLYACNKRMRRVYAAVTLALIAIPTVLSIFLALSMAASSYSYLQERRAYLANLLQMAEAAKAFDSSAARLQPGNEAAFLKGKNREVIAAELQNWLNGAVQESGADLQSIENNADIDDSKKSSIGLSANVFGSWRPALNVLMRIETAQPPLFVRELVLHSPSSYGEQNVEPQISMKISLIGATEISDKEQP